jgi:hypothetical protein
LRLLEAGATADLVALYHNNAFHAILQVFSNYQAIASRTFAVSLIMEFVVSSDSEITSTYAAALSLA